MDVITLWQQYQWWVVAVLTIIFILLPNKRANRNEGSYELRIAEETENESEDENESEGIGMEDKDARKEAFRIVRMYLPDFKLKELHSEWGADDANMCQTGMANFIYFAKAFSADKTLYLTTVEDSYPQLSCIGYGKVYYIDLDDDYEKFIMENIEEVLYEPGQPIPSTSIGSTTNSVDEMIKKQSDRLDWDKETNLK